ncbi:MAG: response regulator [Planctomycetes bacterium]|nr:response regulator [Planctomycetota bacterium]
MARYVSVLVIDKDLDTQRSIREDLRQFGCNVVLAKTLDDGINTFKELEPACVLLDWSIKSGREDPALKVLKRVIEKSGRNTSVIVMAEGVNKKMVEEARELGADWLITKPVNKEIIREKLRTIAGLKGL